MDIDEPIQEFLKSHGWSCEDLLEKLQRIKSTQKKSTLPAAAARKNVEPLQKVADDTNDSGNIETFSDTDEEEVEVNDTNSHIINEIIEDISVAGNVASAQKEAEAPEKVNETTEVTEVRVVEVNEGEDDDFEEVSSPVCSEIFPRRSISLDERLSNDEDTSYLEKIARKRPNELLEELKTSKLTPIDISSDENSRSQSGSNGIEYVETFPRKKIKLGVSVSKKSFPIESVLDVPVNDTSFATKQKCSSTTKIDQDILSSCAESEHDTAVEHIVGQQATAESPEKNYFSTFLNFIGTEREEGKSSPLPTLADGSRSEVKVRIGDTITEKNVNTKEIGVLQKSPWKFIPNVVKPAMIGERILKIRKISRQPKHFKPQMRGIIVSKLPHRKPPAVENETLPCVAETNSFEQNVEGKHETVIAQLGEEEEEEEDDPPSSPIENLEDIRNNLKLQLSCLRTRKKQHIFHPLTTKVEHIECSAKLSTILSSEGEAVKQNESVPEVVKDQDILKKVASEDSELYTQTNELGLVISDVQGGVNLDESGSCEGHSKIIDANDGERSKEQDSFVHSVDSERDAFQDGLLDQIRRIIRKQRSPKKPKELSSTQIRESTRPQSAISQYSHTKSPEKAVGEIISNENSQSSFTNDNIDGPEKISPFVSDTLDEFLVGDSKLNISYKVPKSGAEAGLKEKFIDDSPLLIKKIVEIKETNEKPKNNSSVKAKTVAQKRKILERQRRMALKKHERKVKKADNHKTELVESKKVKIEGGKTCTTTFHANKGYILCNDDKLWVKTTCESKCIAKIGQKKVVSADPLTPRARSLKKLSLLGECKRKLDFRLKYRPGPLCKKIDLQVTGKSVWESQTKCLPNIHLELSPRLGYEFPDDVRSRIASLDGNLDSNRIEFALSMLCEGKAKSEQSLPSKYSLAMNYRNKQEKVLVRKRRVHGFLSSPCKREDMYKECAEDVVSNILEDMIRYVEVKELAPSLIKEDEDVVKQEEIAVKELSPMKSNVSVFKKPQKKRTRFEYELQRLSCKVVNVEVEETPADENCQKPHCLLGCLCKSLKCDSSFSNHCQLVECMFECSCPIKERSYACDPTLTLPAGTDVLSNDAVTKIEDEAKKNMAKVEREFTQTVIQTSDKTIVVGLGGRNKSRRNAKAPAKYFDFVENIEAPKPKVAVDTRFTRKCLINLQRLDLAEIIPYCLVHSLYDCHCKGKSNYVPPVPKLLASNFSNWKRDLRNKIPKKYSLEQQEKEITPSEDRVPYSYVSKYKRSDKKVREQDKQSKEDDYSRSESGSVTSNAEDKSERQTLLKRIPRNIKKKLYDENYIYDNIPTDCSRVKEISAEYRKRADHDDTVFKHDFINNLTDSDMLRANITASKKNRQLLEADLLRQHLLANYVAGKMEKEPETAARPAGKSKRKQILSVREEAVSSSADISLNKSRVMFKAPSPPSKLPKIQPVFDGEIIVDRSNMELLAKMGPKTLQEGYARLLPWKSLTENFRSGRISIWSMVDQPSRLLLNRSDKKAPKNYVDIKESNQTTEVILWILRNKLPANYEENSVSFILKETKDNFEICGVCTKNFIAEQELDVAKTVRGEEERLGLGNNDRQFVHRDLNGDVQVLLVQKQSFKLQELVEECTSTSGEMSVDKDKLYMWAALPEIYRVCKWRVIYLNSDFSYLYFTNIKYSIRYTDLLAVGKIAKDRNCTLTLKNQALQSNYDHAEFGIYFDQHYTDRVFIGPYFRPYQGFDVETLRYINKYLVSTESFNKMRGKNADYKCGHWLVERPYSNTKRNSKSDLASLTARAADSRQKATDRPSEVSEKVELDPPAVTDTIDLTAENDEEREKQIHPRRVLRRRMLGIKDKVSPCMVIMHNTDEIQIIDAPPRKPEEFNRYILTNIPNFGYLGAYRYASGKIDVSWPFENKLLRFPNCSIAVDFLQERFSALLQPVPETFNIQLVVSTEIDIRKNRPIDSNALNGHFVCGEFGFHNISIMADEECRQQLGISRSEILKMFARRAQVFVKKRVEHLASLLKIDKDGTGCFQIEDILNAATEEIHNLSEQDRKNIVKKNELLLRKRDRAIKVFSLISELPSERRNIESLKFRWILNRTEPIEIQDSDDDSKGSSGRDNSQDFEDGKTSPTIKVLKPQECLNSVMMARGSLESYAESSKNTVLADPNNPKSLLKPRIRVSSSLYPRQPSPVESVLLGNGNDLMKIAPPKHMPKLVPKNFTRKGIKLSAGVLEKVVVVPEKGGVSGRRIDEVFTIEDSDIIIEVDKKTGDEDGNNSRIAARETESIVITRVAENEDVKGGKVYEKAGEPVLRLMGAKSNSGGNIVIIKKNPLRKPRAKT